MAYRYKTARGSYMAWWRFSSVGSAAFERSWQYFQRTEWGVLRKRQNDDCHEGFGMLGTQASVVLAGL